MGTAVHRHFSDRASGLTTMRIGRIVRLRLRSLFNHRQVNQDLDAELRDHLERQIELLRTQGLSPEDARTAALREFGNVGLIQEQVLDARRVRWVEDLWRDAKHGVRTLAR